MAEDKTAPTLEEKIAELAVIQSSYAEIAASTGLSVEVLRQDYDAAIKSGWDLGKATLKRAQYKKALEGNPQMLTSLYRCTAVTNTYTFFTYMSTREPYHCSSKSRHSS